MVVGNINDGCAFRIFFGLGDYADVVVSVIFGFDVSNLQIGRCNIRIKGFGLAVTGLLFTWVSSRKDAKKKGTQIYADLHGFIVIFFSFKNSKCKKKAKSLSQKCHHARYR